MAPTKSRWEMQTADSEKEGQEETVTKALSPGQALTRVSLRCLRKSTSTVPVLSHYQTGFETLTKDAAGETKS